jgi:hypothetical protein
VVDAFDFVTRDEVDETNPSPFRSATRRVVDWSLVDAAELRARRQKERVAEQEKRDRAELANLGPTHGFSIEVFIEALVRASSRKPTGPAPSGEHINRTAAKALRNAGFKVDAGDVRRIRALIERYNLEILPEELLPAPLAAPSGPVLQADNVVQLRGDAE